MISRDEKAHFTRDLRSLLIPFFFFRIQIQFVDKNGKKIKRTFYGDEHQCTYAQCLVGYVSVIHLNKQKGYEMLIYLAEVKYKGQYSHATIYGKVEPTDKDFSIIHRHYAYGKEDPEKRNDPVLSPDEIRTVHFTVQRIDGRPHRLQLQQEDPLQHDFKGMVADALK